MNIQGKDFFFQLMDKLVQWQRHENHEPLELLNIAVSADKSGEYFSRILVIGYILNEDRDIEFVYQSIHPNDRKFIDDMTNLFELGYPIGNNAAFYQYCCTIQKEMQISEALKELQQECNLRYPNAAIEFYFPQENKGGCYIATAVYGSYDCPEVWTLRRFRDEKLLSFSVGKFLVKLYYTISPLIVKYFGQTKWFNWFWIKCLNRMVYSLRCKGYSDTPYSDKK